MNAIGFEGLDRFPWNAAEVGSLRSYSLETATSSPLRLPIALYAAASTPLFTKRTEPSTIDMFAPPGCQLRMETCMFEPDQTQGVCGIGLFEHQLNRSRDASVGWNASCE